MAEPQTSELNVPLLQDAVLASLRERLLDGTFPPGTQLNIREVAARLGVSAVPVREALKTLQAEGRLIHERSRGYTVRVLTRGELVQVDELATMIELELIAVGVPKLSQAQVGTMREMLKTVTSGRGSKRRILEAHTQLHFIPYEAAGLPIYLDTVTRLWAHYEPYRLEFFDSDLARESTSSAEHEQFVEACAAGDVEMAKSAHHNHRVNSFRHLIRLAHETEPEH